MRKSVTRMRFSDKQWITSVTRSSPRPRIVNCESLRTTDSTRGIVSKAFLGRGVIGGQDDGSFRAMPINKSLRSVDVDNSAVLDDCHAVAQALRFLHQMSGQKDRLAALANAAHQFPDRSTRLRVQSSGQLVEKHHFRIVDQREGDEETLLLPAREIHEPGVALVGEAELIEQALGV